VKVSLVGFEKFINCPTGGEFEELSNLKVGNAFGAVGFDD